MYDVRSTFSFSVVLFCVLRLFLNALVTDLYTAHTEFALPKPTYAVNIALP